MDALGWIVFPMPWESLAWGICLHCHHAQTPRCSYIDVFCYPENIPQTRVKPEVRREVLQRIYFKPSTNPAKNPPTLGTPCVVPFAAMLQPSE